MALFGKPRVVTLLEVASRAEVLRRRRQVRGISLRAGLGVAAAVFALLLLVWLHLTAWTALSGLLGTLGAAAAVAGVDLVVLLVLGGLAARDRPDALADQAVEVRNAALREAEMEVRTLGGLLRPAPDNSVHARPRVRVYPST